MAIRRAWFLLATLLLGVLFVALLHFALVQAARAADAPLAPTSTHYVAAGASCGSVTPCYGTIQEAVDAAVAGDEIRVAAGLYSGVQNGALVSVTKSLTIRGGYTSSDWTISDPDANPTILDAQNQGTVLVTSGMFTLTVEGLQLVQGSDGALSAGSNTTLIDNVFANNDGTCTAAATLIGSNIVVRDNLFQDNSGGGGNCYNGGGLYLSGSDAIVEGNHFEGNSAYGGGGLSIWGPIAVRNNTFTDNDAIYGGAIHVERAGATLSGNRIMGNQAGQAGSAVSAFPTSLDGEILLVNNLIANNVTSWCSGLGGGSAIFSFGNPLVLLHNTISGNICSAGEGSAIQLGSSSFPASLILTNNIVVSHSVGITVISGSTATVGVNLFGAGNWANGVDWGGEGTVVTGAGILWGDPGFIDPFMGDYHIGLGSAALDAGADVGIGNDIEGNPRPACGAPDIGAHELTSPCIIPTSGGQIETGGIIVTFPADVFSASAAVTLTTVPTSALPERPPNLILPDSQFELTAVYVGSGQMAQPAPGEQYTITATYTPTAQLAGPDIEVALYYWDGAQWQKESTSQADTTTGTVVATPDHLSLWAVMAEPNNYVFLPLLRR